MISPLEKIRAGIETQDIDLVKVGYEELTGQKITQEDSPPSSITEKSDSSDFLAPAQATDNSGQKSRLAKTSPVRAQKNTFVDEGVESKDLETPDIALVPRNRPPAKVKEISCHVCGAKETVAQGVTQGEFHRCAKCSRR